MQVMSRGSSVMKPSLATILLLLLLGTVVNVAVACWIAATVTPWGNPDADQGVHLDDAGHFWSLNLSRKPGSLGLFSYRTNTYGPAFDISLMGGAATDTADLCPRWSVQRVPTDLYADSDHYVMEFRMVEAFGWPLVTLYREPQRRVFEADSPKLFSTKQGPLHQSPDVRVLCDLKDLGCIPTGLTRGPTRSEPVKLPILPIWHGLVVNTVSYAAALWILLSIPLLLRRQIRRLRGRCPKCGYDLRGAPAPGPAPAPGSAPAPERQSGCPECGWNRQETKA